MSTEKLFHVSSDPGISVFEPRPSPQVYEAITGNVVYAITEGLLHHYLLPRDCPRVGWYAGPATSQTDTDRFLSMATSPYVLAVEKEWAPAILATTIYVYELPAENFMLLDECAGYYISYTAVKPVGMQAIPDIFGALLARDIELRWVSSLWPLVDAVTGSTLSYSCIRMKNASPRVAG